MHRFLLLATAAATVGLSVAASAIGRPQAPPLGRTFASWLELVDRHIPAERDAAVEQMAAWGRGDLEALLADVSRRPDLASVVSRAIVLHVDVAILRRRPTSYDLPAGETTMTLFEDGQAVAQTAGTFHWEFARRLIDRLPAGAERLRIARTFYRAAGSVLQGWNEDPELTAHLAAARRVLGADPVLLLYEGTQRQMYAGARAQRFFQERRRSRPDWRPTPLLTGAGDRPAPRGAEPPPDALPAAAPSRAQAEQLFRRALAMDPALVEARIRLAHVLDDRGQHDAAAAEIARVPSTLPRFLDYYAALITGRAARGRGDVATARAAFGRAARIYPDAPVPHLALSELAASEGDRAAALADVERAAGPPETDRAAIDPWWAIERVHEPSAESLVEALRDAFVR